MLLLLWLLLLSLLPELALLPELLLLLPELLLLLTSDELADSELALLELLEVLLEVLLEIEVLLEKLKEDELELLHNSGHSFGTRVQISSQVKHPATTSSMPPQQVVPKLLFSHGSHGAGSGQFVHNGRA